MRRCWVADIEDELPEDIVERSYDTILFSHVLEHLRFPAAVVGKFARLLSESGQVLIAVPNVLSWRTRLRFLLGDFQYESAGVLDDTHLHFYTYVTADKYLLSDAKELSLTHKLADGNVPLWVLRRRFLSDGLRRQFDEYGCRRWPNLFGWQVLIRAEKR
jgi:SAM-dependent methyltransferase